MTENRDDIPPGHTRKPRRIGPLPKARLDWSWPRLSRLEILVLCLVSLVSLVVAIRSEQPLEDYWFVIALAVGAYVEARRARIDDVAREGLMTSFMEIAERAFTALFVVACAGLPGFWLGTKLRVAFGFAPVGG